MGVLTVIEDGRSTHYEQFEPEDRDGMLARYAQLGGGSGPLGDDRRDADRAGPSEVVLGDSPPERLIARRQAAWNRRDRAGIAATQAADLVLVDHRTLGWEKHVGSDAVLDLVSSSWDLWATDQRMTIEEVLASDEQVIALRVVYRGTAREGGGALEMAIGQVWHVEAGVLRTMDFYEPDDRLGMIARYAELGGGQGPLGDSAAERLFSDYARPFAARELDQALALFSEHWVLGDHRDLGWGSVRGRAGAADVLASGWAVSSDLRFEVDEVLASDERLIALRYRWMGTDERGGPAEVAVGMVAALEDGCWVSFDRYDPDDRDAMLARFEALAAPEPRVLRPWEKFDLLYNARRLDELHELYTDDYMMVDRRTMAWEVIKGGAALVETCRSFLDIAPDLRSHCKVIAEAAGFIYLRNTFRGHGLATGEADGGAVELVFDEVGVIRDERFVLTELFDPADEDIARARYDELVTCGPPATPREVR